MIRYRLDELGWRHFEDVCQSLLLKEYGAVIEAWGGSRDLGRDAYCTTDLEFPKKGEIRQGPFVFQAKHVENGNAPGAKIEPPLIGSLRHECSEIKRRIDLGKWPILPRTYCLLTNVRLSKNLREKMEDLLKDALPDVLFVVLGAGEICGMLDDAPNIRATYPELLSYRDVMATLACLKNSYDAENRDKEAARVTRLEAWLNESRARCLERWEALGVSNETALEFADDEDVGRPFAEALPAGNTKLVVVEGGFGAGKSLLAERVYQNACKRYLGKDSGPLPVYLRARDITGTVEEYLQRRLNNLWDCHEQGVFLIFDGLDEAGLANADRILSELRVISRSWTNTLVLATSRPLPIWSQSDKVVQMPLLSIMEAGILVYGRQYADAPYRFIIPDIIREDARRPFFAVLLSEYVRKGNDPRTLASSIDTLSAIIEETCLKGRFSNYRPALVLLKEIAAKCIDAGTFSVARPANIGPEELDDLLQSRLIAVEDNKIRFTLPVLAQWFAMRALKDGDIDIHHILSDRARLQNWFYGLTLLLGKADFDEAKKYLSPIAEEHPGLIAQLISGVVSTKVRGNRTHDLAASECGTRIRDCMTLLVPGLEKLAEIIAPVRPDGSTKAIATRKGDLGLDVSWLEWTSERSDSVDLVSGNDSARNVPRQVALSTVSRGTADHEGWPWDWALDELRTNLKTILRAMALPPIPNTQYWTECMWHTALAVTERGELDYSSIPLDEVESAIRPRICLSKEYQTPEGPKRIGFEQNPIPLQDLLHYAGGFVDGHISRNLSGRVTWPSYLEREVESLRVKGIAHLPCPYRGRDEDFGGGFIWGGFSEGSLIERARQEVTNALQIYVELTERWFKKISDRLNLFKMLPLRYVGRVKLVY